MTQPQTAEQRATELTEKFIGDTCGHGRFVTNMNPDALRFAVKTTIQQAIHDEREACAKICDDWANSCVEFDEFIDQVLAVRNRAAAIRSRK